MRITRDDLDQAANAGLLAPGQTQALWDFLSHRASPVDETPRFKPAHILYYLGGLVALGAMSLFMTLGWEQFGGGGLLAIALAYAVLGVALSQWLLQRQLLLPASLTAALAVVMAPLAIYGLQRMLGLWDEGVGARAYRDYHALIDWRWLLMELGTLVVAVVALRHFRLPFLMLPLAVTLWYLSMDLVPFLLQGERSGMFSEEGRRITTAFGACMLIVALWVDIRTRSPRDFAFWLYVFGLLTFWCGLTSLDADSEFGRFAYLCINLALIALGAALARRAFAVFGALGVALYLGHLSHTVFKDSLLFPLALTAIGLGIIGAGIAWQRHEHRLGAALRGRLPSALRMLVERRTPAP